MISIIKAHRNVPSPLFTATPTLSESLRSRANYSHAGTPSRAPRDLTKEAREQKITSDCTSPQSRERNLAVNATLRGFTGVDHASVLRIKQHSNTFPQTTFTRSGPTPPSNVRTVNCVSSGGKVAGSIPCPGRVEGSLSKAPVPPDCSGPCTAAYGRWCVNMRVNG